MALDVWMLQALAQGLRGIRVTKRCTALQIAARPRTAQTFQSGEMKRPFILTDIILTDIATVGSTTEEIHTDIMITRRLMPESRNPSIPTTISPIAITQKVIRIWDIITTVMLRDITILHLLKTRAKLSLWNDLRQRLPNFHCTSAI
jgi:hypothetical protein